MPRGSRKPDEGKNIEAKTPSLREVVREALMNVITDKSASAAAKASAGRTLLEFYGDEANGAGRGRRAAELTADELDREIARLTPGDS